MAKVYTNRSNANRAAKRFVEQYDVEYKVTGDAASGFAVVIVARNAAQEAAARDADFMVECLFDDADPGFPAPAPAPSAEDEAAYAEQQATAEDEEPEADDEQVAAYFAREFAVQFIAAGGELPRGRCNALRVVAAAWEGTRGEFIKAAVAFGLPKATANSNYQVAYK